MTRDKNKRKKLILFASFVTEKLNNWNVLVYENKLQSLSNRH